IVAFQKLAHGVYLEWNKPVVAVTGSAGKTTARELTAHVLASSGRKVLRSIKNYNNGLGLPITVLNLAKDNSSEVAVLEMGMSTPNNEIARLTRITPPTVAVVLNVLPVHIEHLGTIENIAKAKAELVEGMKPGGTVILNADDFRVAAMSSLSKGKTITYGLETQADVMAKNIRFEHFGETYFTLQTPNSTAEVSFPLNGKHNILNALAAAAVGVSFGMSAQEIAESLKTVASPPNRGEVLRFAEGLRSALHQPLEANGESFRLSLSVGIALCSSAMEKGEGRELSEEILRQASLALGVAKAAGGNRVEFFERSMGERVRAVFDLERALARALSAEGEAWPFALFLQPQVEVTGA
ncbi:MAG: Mur ligase family protein, partial [Saprospiraceae bacterium]